MYTSPKFNKNYHFVNLLNIFFLHSTFRLERDGGSKSQTTYYFTWEYFIYTTTVPSSHLKQMNKDVLTQSLWKFPQILKKYPSTFRIKVPTRSTHIAFGWYVSVFFFNLQQSFLFLVSVMSFICEESRLSGSTANILDLTVSLVPFKLFLHTLWLR